MHAWDDGSTVRAGLLVRQVQEIPGDAVVVEVRWPRLRWGRRDRLWESVYLVMMAGALCAHFPKVGASLVPMWGLSLGCGWGWGVSCLRVARAVASAGCFGLQCVLVLHCFDV